MALLDLVRHARVQMTGKNRRPTIDGWRAVPFTGLAAVELDIWRPVKDWSSIPGFF